MISKLYSSKLFYNNDKKKIENNLELFNTESQMCRVYVLKKKAFYLIFIHFE